MYKQVIVFILALIIISVTANVSAQAYKWKDDNGNVIYSQTPPPLGTPYELVDDASIAASGFGVARSSNLQEKAKDAEKARQQKQEQQKLIAESEQIKKENCAQARTNLNALTSRGQVTIKEGDLYRKLTEEERQERIQQANNSIKEFCN